MSNTQFTTTQLNNWWDYEAIRLSGHYNMFDRRARDHVDMSEEEWIFCMKNYIALKAAAESTEGTPA